MYINGLTFPVLFSRVYWPLFVLIFYVLSPIPTFISRRLSDGDSSSNACRELAYFLTTGIVVSSFGLPIVLARKETVGWPCPRYIKSCLCRSHCKFVESFNRRDRIQCDSCVFFFYRFSGVLVVWWWQETPSSSSQFLASSSCLEEEMISAGSSGRVGVDSGQLERETDRWVGGWVGGWILTQIDCRRKGMCVCHSTGWYSCF